MTICLNMIVKNESHIIESTLKNLIHYITFDYWVICDTGSTDATCSIIETFFKEHNIPGELFHHEWKDFAHNRTLALQCAFNKTDYILVFDADDSIHGEFVLPPLTADSYMLQFGQGFTYMRPLLFTNRKRWMYRGVLHEYLEAIDTMTSQINLLGNYYVESGRTGNRSLQPDKYYKDALVLEKAFEEEPPNGLKPRYAFYCAQSYRDAGSYNDKSIEWYKKVLTFQHHWNQEHYYSCLQLGHLYKDKGDMDQSIYYYLKTIEYDSERIEGVVCAMGHFFQANNHTLVNALYQKFKNYSRTVTHKLFVNLYHYNDRIEYYNSISAFYVNDKQSGYQCCKDIILHQKLDKHEFNNILQNIFVFYRPQLDSDSDTLSLFYAIDKLQPLPSTDLWNYLFQRNREKLTTVTPTMLQTMHSVSQQSMLRGHEGLQDKIILTFTTCKRLALFKETIHSILVHWKDLHLVTHWLCVDDNSSMEDRQFMMKTYPWIRFYMKSEQEKGHCNSMNIIWDVLHTLKPKYWIHMEDDFLFHRSMPYIQPFLPILDSDSSIHQIVYNRNYGETIEDYDILGHVESTFPNIVLHNHGNLECSYRNCHYWPNYSFRPSICLVEPILQLGKFNFESSFFEKEFAHRWTIANYKTAFYNGITHRHIGRLTSEIGKVKNAYDLNHESQFGIQTLIKIINLTRRPDRKRKTQKQLEPILPMWIQATDGLQLDPSPSLKQLFQGNDFGSKRGVIGCALSHYKLWEQLLIEPIHDYYLIMEDDITVCPDFKTKLDQSFTYMQTNSPDLLFLGYHMFTHNRNEVKDVYDCVTSESTVHAFQNELYVGGFFSYIIHKTGAQKILDYIRIHGIKHGIDYLVKIIPGLNIQELRPFIVHSPWYEFASKPIDTDIQLCHDNLFIEYDQFRFMPQLDQQGFDLNFQKGSLTSLLRSALQNEKCAAVNTLGFFKHTIQTLSPSFFFKETDGIYIKIHPKPKMKKVKMLCNWCSSEQLCKEWANMYDPSSNFIMTSDHTDIDYYVVINSTQEFFEPSKTIVFQMEPWVHSSSPWGVKTWGDWATPDPSLFLKVRGRHSKCHNNVLWQLELTYPQLQTLTYPAKQDRLSTICSSKYFDPGHIARIDFLRFLDKKVDWLDIYNSDNSFEFKHYKGPCTPYVDKSKGILPYKYYFMVENNYEENFITEKLWEPILCESLCFYYGCPNVTDYLDERAFVLLPLDDFEACLQIIQTAIREDWWSQRLPFIQQEKQKILKELSFCAVVNTIVKI